MKNLHKHKNLMGFIYALVMLLPFATILARCLYVQLNKNAYQSYSGHTTNDIVYKYETNEVDSIDDLVVGNIYEIDLTSYVHTTGTTRFLNAYRIIGNRTTYLDLSFDYNTAGTLNLYANNNNTLGVVFSVGGNEYYYTIDKSLITFVYYGSFNSSFISLVSESSYNEIIDVNIDNSGTLDNVLDYSIDKTIEGSNIGRLNLTNWFVDIFLDDSNVTNMRYINFVNWYMNYSLLVSCVYLLYMVLMWFLTFARRLLSKGFNEEI